MGQSQTKTNDPLFYAQRLLSIYQKSKTSSSQQDQHALMTGVWLCVKESWFFWVNELSAYMNLERAEGYQLDEMDILLDADLPEGQLLLGLLDDSQSWLSLLLKRIGEPTKRLKSSKNGGASDVNLIALVSMDEVDEGVLIERVLLEFKKYIESVRVRQVEW